MNINNFVSGYIPSPEDPRNYTLESIGVPVAYGAQTWGEISATYTSPVYNQGQFGMCLDFTFGSIVEAIEESQRKIKFPLANGFLYGNRATTDYKGEGLVPIEALKNLTKLGIPRKSVFNVYGDYPTCAAAVSSNLGNLDGEGLPQRPRGYVQLNGIEAIYTYIKKFQVPVFIGLVLTESFWNIGTNGIVPAPAGAIVGGHAMQIIGIKKFPDRYRLKIQNQWGTEWGDHGYCYLDINEHPGKMELWGIIPQSADVMINRPQTLFLRLKSNVVFVDDKQVTWPMGPVYVGDKTMVPVREICEVIGAKVVWYRGVDGNDMVIITFAGEQAQKDVLGI